MPYKILSLTLLSLIYALPVLCETLYVKKNNTKMTVEKSPMSGVVALLQKGAAVTIIKKEGRHYKVRPSGGKSGWVFKFKLKKTRPAVKSGSGSLLAGLTGESTVSARESGSEGSIRGLKKVSKNYAKAKSISPRHIEAVERMEKFSLSEKELLEFKRAGALGEFSN